MDSRDSEADRNAGTLALKQELNSIVAAIEFVASGAGRRVTLAGLHFGAVLAPEAERRAAPYEKVRVRALWPMGDGPVDLVIEATGSDV